MQRLRKNTTDNHGFTLIELLVVLSIIAIIAGILFPTISTIKENARVARARAMMSTIGLALQAYRTDWGVFGPTEDELNDDGTLYEMLTTAKKNGPYMELRERDILIDGSDKKIIDPWGGIYEVYVDVDGGSNAVPPHNRHSFDIETTDASGDSVNNWD